MGHLTPVCTVPTGGSVVCASTAHSVVVPMSYHHRPSQETPTTTPHPTTTGICHGTSVIGATATAAMTNPLAMVLCVVTPTRNPSSSQKSRPHNTLSKPTNPFEHTTQLLFGVDVFDTSLPALKTSTLSIILSTSSSCVTTIHVWFRISFFSNANT